MQRNETFWAFVAGLVILLVAGALAWIRLAGPPDLMMYDQERQAAYVLDVVQNGHWVCQRDVSGEIASKPPLYNWIAAAATRPFDRINRFSVAFPSVLSTVLIALLIFGVGRTHFGWRAGFLGAIAYLLTLSTAKQVAVIRTDALFALTVTLTALAGYRAWRVGRGWLWFWLGAAAATLTKGPLGLALGATGLIAPVWDWWSGYRVRWHGSHLLGVFAFLLVTVVWFLWAYAVMGWPLIDKMIFKELFGHTLQAHDHIVFPGRWFYKPPLYFLLRFAPASFISLFAFWRLYRSRAVDDEERRFERFLFCWFWGGMVIFCLAASQRQDHLMPLWPAAALLAGRELARWTMRWKAHAVVAAAMTVAAVLLAAIYVDYWILELKEDNIRATIGMRALAQELRSTDADQSPLVHVDDPFALQFYLNTCQPTLTFDEAANRLRTEPNLRVAVCDLARLTASFGTNAVPLKPLARWPTTGTAIVQVVTTAKPAP